MVIYSQKDIKVKVNEGQICCSSISVDYSADMQHNNDTSCITTTIVSIDEFDQVKNTRQLLKITDLLGRQTKGTKNESLFYIYDDGTVEKKIILE